MKSAFLAMFLFGGIAVAADDEASKKKLLELEGTYSVVSFDKNGEMIPGEILKTFQKVTIKGNKLTMTFKEQGKTEANTATIKVDASKRIVAIDLTADDGEKKGETTLCIAEINDDTVKLCWGTGASTKRPTDATSTKENMNFLITLKRIKE